VSFEVTIEGGEPRRVTATRTANGATLWIDGEPHPARLTPDADAILVRVGDRAGRAHVHIEGDVAHVHALGRTWRVEIVDPAERSAAAADHADVVSAPMPGSVVAMPVAAGEEVALGQPLVVIESMKMQSELVATRDGVVARLHLEVGDTFDRGAALVSLEPLA
jgi:acetyl/propionyl-CoA carboxylase alpha subunit